MGLLEELDIILAKLQTRGFNDPVYSADHNDQNEALSKIREILAELTSEKAPTDPTYITRDNELPSLPNSIRHQDLSGAYLHEPKPHNLSHELGGGDVISVLGLSGLLADPQTPLAHASSHENTGGDEISVDGLSGLLADPQTPLAHNQDANTITSGILAEGRGGLGKALSPTWTDDYILVYDLGTDTFIMEAKPTGVDGSVGWKKIVDDESSTSMTIEAGETDKFQVISCEKIGTMIGRFWFSIILNAWVKHIGGETDEYGGMALVLSKTPFTVGEEFYYDDPRIEISWDLATNLMDWSFERDEYYGAIFGDITDQDVDWYISTAFYAGTWGATPVTITPAIKLRRAVAFVTGVK